ncbi:hypothetical protein C6501_13410 [Candidatus Poribacteria bacterium]|nr:MAG: hypothetical protein C6501_13410 [Candidatus Poribacteria bacterium]
MKIGRIGFYLWMLVLLPLTTYAELTGTVVYKHPYNSDEIWVTDIRDTRNARLLFKHTNVIRDLSVQKNSRYIVIVSRNENNPFKEDTYLIDTLRDKAILIQDRIDDITNIDISHGGDVVLTSRPGAGNIQKRGIYLIRRSEIGKQDPRITLLKEGSIPRVDWAPNGKEIAYDSVNGLFQIDVNTKKETRISREGDYPAFSPDGKKLVYSYVNVATGNPQIDIISLDTLQPLITIDLIVHPIGFNWSPDGEYLIYTVHARQLFEKEIPYRNIAIPINGGSPERILDITNRGVEMFDWINPAYPVEPKNHLATLWGKIKQ